jgi:hypothetical protein
MTEQDKALNLRSRHSALDVKIECEGDRPLPDELLVANLKREKLKIKDELASMNAL